MFCDLIKIILNIVLELWFVFNLHSMPILFQAEMRLFVLRNDLHNVGIKIHSSCLQFLFTEGENILLVFLVNDFILHKSFLDK